MEDAPAESESPAEAKAAEEDDSPDASENKETGTPENVSTPFLCLVTAYSAVKAWLPHCTLVINIRNGPCHVAVTLMIMAQVMIINNVVRGAVVACCLPHQSCVSC